MKLPLALANTLEKSINLFIELDSENKDKLVAMQGRVINLYLHGMDLDIFLFLHADAIEVLTTFDGEIDTKIAGNPGSMLAMTAGNQALFAGEVEITGDVETGKKFKRYLDSLEIDWEEHLSRFIGDSVSYQLGLAFRNLRDFADKTVLSMHQNVAEYLNEESELTAPKTEIARFIHEVDTLRAAFDRLDARISELEKMRENRQ